MSFYNARPDRDLFVRLVAARVDAIRVDPPPKLTRLFKTPRVYLLAFLVLTYGAVIATPAPAAAPPSGTASFAAPDSFWNAPLGADPALDPSSPSLVAGLASVVTTEETLASGPWINTTSYSTPIYSVSGSQPTVVVTLDASDPALQRALDAVPLPTDAVPAAGTDAQLVLMQPSTNRMWEFWQLHRAADGWHAAGGGAMDDVTNSDGVFDNTSWPGAEPWWGATATGLPLLGGLITLADLQSGIINHALALAVPTIRVGVWASPAEHSDGTDDSSTALPAGARLRIDPALDLDSLHLPPLTLMIARAAQTYGMIVRDYSADVDFYAEDPTPLGGTNPYTNNPTGPSSRPGGYFDGESPAQLLATFPWSSLQVLRMNLQCPTGPCPSPSTPMPAAPPSTSVLTAPLTPASQTLGVPPATTIPRAPARPPRLGLTRVTLSGRTLTRSRPLVLSFSMARPASVVVTVEPANVHGPARILSHTMAAVAGPNHYVLRVHLLTTHHMPRGPYVVCLRLVAATPSLSSPLGFSFRE